MPQRRKPNTLRALHGQAQRVTIMAPPLEDDRPPAWLPREAKAEWRRVMTCVKASHVGHIQTLDRPSLTAYTMTWSTWLGAAKDVAERGALVPGRSSADTARGEEPALVKNPSVQVMRDAGIQLQRWCREFGFTPDSRGRMDVPGPPNDDDRGARLLS